MDEEQRKAWNLDKRHALHESKLGNQTFYMPIKDFLAADAELTRLREEVDRLERLWKTVSGNNDFLRAIVSRYKEKYGDE